MGGSPRSEAFGAPRTVWWVVAAGGELRHATRELPGSWVEGLPLPVLCERVVKAPLATPAGRVPSSVEVHERCYDCTGALQGLGEVRCREWDA